MDTLIVIVTHNGAQTIAETLARCLESNTDIGVMVVDNASLDQTARIARFFCDKRVFHRFLDQNQGVGAGFNQGLAEAVRRNIPWMMVLDQDSLPEENMPARMVASATALFRENPSLGAVFPLVRCRRYPDVIHNPWNWTGTGFASVIEDPSDSRSVQMVDTSISSGTLYRVGALCDTGGFDESFFIDFVDHECHLRMRQKGFTLWWDRRVELHHNLGKIQRMTPEGLWIEHEPFRYYYMARNMTVGYWRFGGIRAVWKLLEEIRSHIGRLQRNSTSAAACRRYIRKGMIHAFLGKTGPLDPDS